eukprot:gnl/MRDRNA2_/MRDRNA2_247749_c0_seq1.p1 gnl/MRDRNA2_/MRDRNA2_247749_c0~~gnl/MRDRNA2_/MRDRNA2_247749_c0_seq1.p1  ORF type:complete len:113 (+),score=6.87 gnl/MRDRNA2_/MRDRNA2_247749_c0_seq1:208-546(+)
MIMFKLHVLACIRNLRLRANKSKLSSHLLEARIASPKLTTDGRILKFSITLTISRALYHCKPPFHAAIPMMCVTTLCCNDHARISWTNSRDFSQSGPFEHAPPVELIQIVSS